MNKVICSNCKEKKYLDGDTGLCYDCNRGQI
jgi:hypothetical protein